MAAGGRVVGRDPDETVDPLLSSQVAISPRPVHRERRGLDPRLFSRKKVDKLHLELAPLRPALVHPQEHLGPVLGFRPPCARVDGDNGVVVVVFPVEQHERLGLLQLPLDT